MAAKKKAAKKTASKKVGKKNELTAKQAAFVDEYLIDLNATQAAIRAGYAKKSAGAIGDENLKKPAIAAAVKARRDELAAAHHVTQDKIIKSLSNAVHFDPRKLYRDDGSLKPVHELDDETADALEGLEVVTSGDSEAVLYTKKYKWSSKNTAREQAMKHLGLYEKDNHQRGVSSVPTDELKAELLRQCQAQGIDLSDLLKG